MDLKHFLEHAGVDPASTLVLRHSPVERELRRVLPWLAAESPEVFNAYQRYHFPRVEAQMCRAKHVASFIGDQPGRAVFVGVYRNTGHRDVSRRWRSQHKAFSKLAQFGHIDQIGRCLWFDLRPTEALQEWSGRLIIEWPGLERSWSRWATSASGMPVQAITEESSLTEAVPDWRNLVLTWAALHQIPRSWRDALRQWRGIYFIFDQDKRQGYVGSAYGTDNILGRWLEYSASGHGGNKKLKACNPEHFQFSILELLTHDAPKDEVIQRESFWKDRLHTREFGLNDN